MVCVTTVTSGLFAINPKFTEMDLKNIMALLAAVIRCWSPNSAASVPLHATPVFSCSVSCHSQSHSLGQMQSKSPHYCTLWCETNLRKSWRLWSVPVCCPAVFTLMWGYKVQLSWAETTVVTPPPPPVWSEVPVHTNSRATGSTG